MDNNNNNNNNKIEIKVTADTSDLEKSIDGATKKVDKKAGKMEKSFNDLSKSLNKVKANMNNAFNSNNTNLNGLTNQLNKLTNVANRVASNVKSALKKAFNVEGKITVKQDVQTTNTTANGNGMATALAGSAMTGGAIGSKISKELAQSQGEVAKEVTKAVGSIKEAFGQVPETVQKDVKNSVSEIINTLGEVEPFLLSIFSDENLKLDIDLSSVKDLKGLAIGMLDNFKANIESLESGMRTLIRLKEKLSAKGKDKDALFIEEQMEVQQEEIDRYTGYLEKLQNLLNSGAFDKIDFATNLDTNKIVVEIDRLLGKFEEIPVVMKKADAQPIVEQFRLLQQAMQSLGYDTSAIDNVLTEWDRMCRNGSKGTIELTNAIKQARTYVTGLNQGTKQLVQTQIQYKQRQDELKQQTTTLGQVLTKAKYHLQDFGTALKRAFSGGMQKAGQYIDNLRIKSKQLADAHKQAADKIKSANAGITASFKSLLATMAPFLTIVGVFNLFRSYGITRKQ